MLNVGIILELVIGILLLVICVVVIGGDIFGYFFASFAIFVAIVMVIDGIRRIIINIKTSFHGEKCYARVLECTKSGTFIGNKEDYFVNVVAFIPSLGKRLFLKESVGFNGPTKYPKDTYLSICYYNDDINVSKIVDKNEVPKEILNSLNESSIKEEYQEYVRSELEKKREMEDIASEKAMVTIDKIQLIYKRIILGFFILILLLLVVIDSVIMKQTIVAKDYIETKAIYNSDKDVVEDEVFDNYIYTFQNKKGEQQEITVSISKREVPKKEIIIKYNEKDPQDYYTKEMLFDQSGILWYIVKIVALELLIVLFFNKRLLGKIGFSINKS